MKTKALFFSSLALLAIACTKENLVENSGNNNNEGNANLIQLPIFGTIEGSKTELGEDGKTVKWLPGDAISVYPLSGTTTKGGVKFTTTNGDGWFTNEEGIAKSGTYYALYYYRNSQWVADKSAIQTKLFPDQYAKVGSFDDDLAYMAGKLDLTNPEKPTVEFKNICSHIRFTLTSDIASQRVKSLTLMGNNGETISGVFQLTFDEAGNPMTTPTDPDIYVRLYDKNGSNLAAGDYYFTVLPQTFKDGFTVIISKEDGTQIAAKTTKNTIAVSTRNSILKMGTPKEYKEHLNYFVKYLDGFDIAVGDPEKGGYKFNKKNHAGGKMLHDGQSNKTIKADGVYFIDNKSSNIKVSYNDLEKLIICAVDSESKAEVGQTKALRPKTNEFGVLLFENILLKSTSDDVIQQKKATEEPGTKFGHIVFNNCILKDLPRHVVNILNAATNINTISISNCDYSTTAAGSSFITFASQESTLSNVYAYNNVFYYSGTSNMTDFKILNIQAGTVDNIVIQNNTFAKTTIPNAGLVVAGKVSKTGIVNNNLFDDVVIGTLVQDKGQHSTLVNLKFDSDPNQEKIQPFKAENVNITYNYYFSTYSIQEGTQYLLNRGNLTGSVSNSVGAPVVLEKSPLAETWVPANGTYGPYTIKPVESGKDPGSNIIGAVRHDTVTKANTAAYRYAPNELGSF